MAIRVLGRKDSVFPIMVACYDCHSLLEVDGVTDLKVTNIESTRYASVECPVCKARVFLEGSTLIQALLAYEAQNLL